LSKAIEREKERSKGESTHRFNIMKRALAERANKTSSSSSPSSTFSSPTTGQSSVAVKRPFLDDIKPDSHSPSVVRSSSIHAPPNVDSSSNASKKRQRRDDPQSTIANDENGDNSNSKQQAQTQAPRPVKRGPGRPASKKKKKKENNSDSENEDDQNSAYYLRYQNQALASELYKLKEQIGRLESDRIKFLSHGKEIQDGVERMVREWKSGVSSICGILYTLGFMGQQDQKDFENIPREIRQLKLFHEETINSDTTSTLPSSFSSLKDNIISISSSFPSISSDIKIEEDNKSSQLTFDDLSNLSNLLKTSMLPSSDQEHSIRKGINHWLQSVAVPTLTTFQDDHAGGRSPSSAERILSLTNLHRHIAHLEQSLSSHEQKLDEMIKERDEAQLIEKKIRRSLYRIAAGRLQADKVIEDLGGDPDDSLEINGATSLSAAPDNVSSSANGSLPASNESNDDTIAKDSASSGNISEETKKKIMELEVLCKSRDDSIKELMEERVKLQKHVNELLSEARNSKILEAVNSIPEEQIKQTYAYLQISKELNASQKIKKELEEKLQDVTKKWGVTKADCEHANKTMEELIGKHTRRWESLTTDSNEGESIPNTEKNGNDKITSPAAEQSDAFFSLYGDIKPIEKSDITPASVSNKKDILTFTDKLEYTKKISELEHKLSQAVESSRRSEALRHTLNENNKMLDILHSQVNEWKSKYTALSANKSTSRSSSSSAEQSNKKEGSASKKEESTTSTSTSTSSSRGEASYERLKLDFRKCRKELAAANNSRENYKNKIERIDKERESIIRTNNRLLKQNAEKEEINTKSLSQVLHLRHMLDLKDKEIKLLEEKAKSAEQLVLTSRLVMNAKSKVEEECKKEKELLEKNLEDVNKIVENTRAESEEAKIKAVQSKNEVATVMKDLEVLKTRCDELATESSSNIEKQTKLKESLAIAKKEAEEAIHKKNKRSAARGGFSVDDLSAYANELKKRLACPVCNDRDKECILLRCRHMFCRHCVDENIKNRSRKCPACGQRFDTKDVGDIFL